MSNTYSASTPKITRKRKYQQSAAAAGDSARHRRNLKRPRIYGSYHEDESQEIEMSQDSFSLNQDFSSNPNHENASKLPPFKWEKFHVQNFKSVLSHVQEIHGHLLHSHETKLIEEFYGFSKHAQDIYTRLYNRQPVVFRAEEIAERYLVKDEALWTSFQEESSAEEPLQDSPDIVSASSSSAIIEVKDSDTSDDDVIFLDEKPATTLETSTLEQSHTTNADQDYFEQDANHPKIVQLTDKIWKELCEHEFVTPMHDEATLLKHVMKKTELLQIAKEMKIKVPSNLQRSQLAARILKEHKSTKSGLMKFFTRKTPANGAANNSALMRVIKKVLGVQTGKSLKFYSMSSDVKSTFAMMHRLFYLNQSEDQTAQVLQSMQVFKFVPVRVNSVSMFYSREDFDEYEAAKELWETLAEISMLKVNEVETRSDAALEMIDQITKSFDRCAKRYKENGQDKWPVYKLRYTPGWIYCKALWHGVAILEKLKLFEKASLLLRKLIDSPFCPGRRGKFYNRLSIDLKHMKEHQQALDVCVNALQEEDSLTVAHRLTLEKRAEKLCKKGTTLPYTFQLIGNLQKAEKRNITGKRAEERYQTKVKTMYVNQRQKEIQDMNESLWEEAACLLDLSNPSEMEINLTAVSAKEQSIVLQTPQQDRSASSSMPPPSQSLSFTPDANTPSAANQQQAHTMNQSMSSMPTPSPIQSSDQHAHSLASSLSTSSQRYLSEIISMSQGEFCRPLEGKLLTVEEVALQHYRLEVNYPRGLHCEGSIFRMLYSLIFWDIIYDDTIPGVWQTKYQVAPLDLGTESYFEARREKILERLELMENDERAILEMIELRHEENREYRSVIDQRSFETYPADMLTSLYECVGGKVMAGICRVWNEDYRTRSGFPDLILWNEEEKKALFSEVKGPRDRLSDKQRFWINMLISFGANVEVCHVSFEEEEEKQDEEENETRVELKEEPAPVETKQCSKRKRRISRKKKKVKYRSDQGDDEVPVAVAEEQTSDKVVVVE